MTGQLSFWDVEVWSFVVTLAILFGAMLLANALRRQVPFLRRSLIPSSVLGGFLVLAADAAFKAIFGHSMFTTSTLEALTFHGLGLGFVAMALRHTEKIKGKKARRDVFATSTVVVGSYLLQALLGLIVTVALFYLIGSYAAGGVLLPMGYGQGPGQAYNWGSIYQGYTEYPAFRNGASFGLTIAAMGFISASVGGVYYLNKLRRAGDKRAQVVNAEEIEDLSAEMVTGKDEIPLSESLDKLTVQLGLVFVSYFLAYAAMAGVTVLLDRAGGFAVNTVKPLIWGFNFLIGTVGEAQGKGRRQARVYQQLYAQPHFRHDVRHHGRGLDRGDQPLRFPLQGVLGAADPAVRDRRSRDLLLQFPYLPQAVPGLRGRGLPLALRHADRHGQHGRDPAARDRPAL